VWNCNNFQTKDRGTLSCNVELRRAGKIVWSKKAIPLAWSKDEEPATTIPLPRIAFDALRVEAGEVHGLGPALSEVEIFRGDDNLARGKTVTASAVYDARFPAAAIVDGIKNSQQFAAGYWVAPDNQHGWVEVQVAPPTESGKHSAEKK
jgi:hypothetical protein